MTDNRFVNRSELIGILVLAAHPGRDPAALPRRLPPQPGRQIPDLRLRRAGPGDLLGLWRHPEPRAGRVLRPRRLLHGDVPQARGLERREHQDPVDARHSRFHGLEPDHRSCRCSGSRSTASPSRIFAVIAGARPVRLHHRCRDVQAPRRRRLLRHHHPGGRRDPDHPDRRPAGLHRRHQRHHRSAHPAGLGHPHRPRQDRALLRRGRAAVRLHLRRPVHPALQARPHPGRDARQGGPRALLRLRRRQLQDLRLLRRRGLRRDRRRDVHAAGRLHVAVLRRHRAVDRDGDLHRGRRPAVDPRRGLRHAAGQLRQDQPLGILSGTLAVRARRHCSSRSCWPSRTAWPGSGATTWQPQIDRLFASGKSKRHGWTDKSVADGAPAE